MGVRPSRESCGLCSLYPIIHHPASPWAIHEIRHPVQGPAGQGKSRAEDVDRLRPCLQLVAISPIEIYSCAVHVITRKRLREFSAGQPEADVPLRAWYAIVSQTDFTSFAELKRVFRTADKVGKFTVFNVGGNKFRLVAAVHYNRRKIYIRHVLTHAEYDRGKWKE